MSLTESMVEDAALTWFGKLVPQAREVEHGPQMAPGEPAADRDSFSEVVQSRSTPTLIRPFCHGKKEKRETIRRLNPASQKLMGVLYDVETNTVNYHPRTIFEDNELHEDSVIRRFRITAGDGKTYDTQHYTLSAIVTVGYKANSERAVHFRKWATGIIESFTIKGYAMDDERRKSDGSILGKKYFD